MLLVCDNADSPRARNLRNRLISDNYPCAVEDGGISSRITPYIVITYEGSDYSLRNIMYSETRAIIIGKCRRNANLPPNVVWVDGYDQLKDAIEDYFNEKFHTCRFPFGTMYDSGVYMAKKFITVYGNILMLTDIEYLIFKYLYMNSQDRSKYFSADKIYLFCLKYHNEEEYCRDASNIVAVHIFNINKKAKAVLDRKIIRSRRNSGYQLNML